MSPTTHRTPGETFAGYTELEAVACANCGVLFAPPEALLDKRREDGATFYCPNGHHLVFKSENERLRKELAQVKDRLATERSYHDQTQARLSATKGVVTKQRKKLEKVVAGVCPVEGCKRHFKDLRRHISTKHPDYHGQS